MQKKYKFAAMTHTPEHKVHEGRNVKRFREMLGIKQEALAIELGDDWTQKKVSLLEAKETIEPAILERVAGILKLPVEAIQNFDEEQAVNIISNTFNTHDQSSGMNVNPNFNINPAEKWMEALEEIKRLNIELLKVKDEQIKMLESLINK